MAKFLWTQRQNIGPAPRAGHAMAYDEQRRAVVLFGGDSGRGPLGDTWVWNGETWTQVSDIGPAARAGHAMAYDEQRGRVVLFGGRLRDRQAGDTWEWDGGDWTQIANAGPGPRSNPAMAYLRSTRRVILFGGFDGALASLADTWEWNGEDWTQLEDVGPDARHSHVMASDPLGQRVVLFGGDGAAGTLPFQDTWAWDGEEWTRVAVFGPAPVANAGMVAVRSRLILFGGMLGAPDGGPRALSGLTWEWSGRHWTLRQDIGPGARMAHGMAFDRVRSRVVIFGGARVDGPSPLGDTWEHVDQSAAVVPPPVAPFDFAIQPTSGTFRDNASAVFVVPPLPQATSVTLTYTAPALAGVPTFLRAVMIPPNVTNQQVSLPLQQMFATLTNNGFVAPGDVTITATTDDQVSTSAVFRFLPG